MTGSAASQLSSADRERITEAIRLAESRTSGEIVVLVAARAGLYRSVGLALALVAALALPWPLIVLTALSAGVIALIQAATVLAILGLTLDARLRLLFVPRPVRRGRAHEAASRQFLSQGLTRTRNRTGVLVYVALAERYAEIVADDGIRARVPDATWCGVVADLLAAAGRQELAGGLVAAVGRVGAILAAELPPGGEGGEGDELENRVVVLD